MQARWYCPSTDGTLIKANGLYEVTKLKSGSTSVLLNVLKKRKPHFTAVYFLIKTQSSLKWGQLLRRAGNLLRGWKHCTGKEWLQGYVCARGHQTVHARSLHFTASKLHLS